MFAVGLRLEGLWADWYKPVPILGRHVAGLPPSGLFPFPHLLQHLNVFPELYLAFLGQRLGFRSEEDTVSAPVFNFCGECTY